jgi:chemotaxis protein methyltransferase CheR
VAARKLVLGKVRRQLRPDGYLFLGGAETTFGLDDGFEREQVDRAVCYRVARQRERASGAALRLETGT